MKPYLIRPVAGTRPRHSVSRFALFCPLRKFRIAAVGRFRSNFAMLVFTDVPCPGDLVTPRPFARFRCLRFGNLAFGAVVPLPQRTHFIRVRRGPHEFGQRSVFPTETIALHTFIYPITLRFRLRALHTFRLLNAPHLERQASWKFRHPLPQQTHFIPSRGPSLSPHGEIHLARLPGPHRFGQGSVTPARYRWLLPPFQNRRFPHPR